MKYKDVIEIEGGGHFVIADKAAEISAIVNKKVKNVN